MGRGAPLGRLCSNAKCPICSPVNIVLKQPDCQDGIIPIAGIISSRFVPRVGLAGLVMLLAAECGCQILARWLLNVGFKFRGGITGKHNPMLHKSLLTVMRWFKGRSTYQINRLRGRHKFAWQPRFYDSIIRNEKSLGQIRQYIIDNPRNWAGDRNNPER